MKHTAFAPAERATPDELQKNIQVIARNPLINEILRVTSGFLAVLNKHRQIIAINDSFLELLEIDGPETAFGLRPGEYIRCVHSDKCEGGCGTSEYCKTCGAAISIVAAIADMKPLERMCAVKVRKNGRVLDMFFKVRCIGIEIDNGSYYLLFLNDYSKQQEWANLEKVFYHDINNIIYALLGRSELLLLEAEESGSSGYIKEIFHLCRRLLKEMEIQKSLSQSEMRSYQPFYEKTTTSFIINEMKIFFADHTAVKHKNLIFPEAVPEISFQTDISLLVRILSNMILNALEASTVNDSVKLSVSEDPGMLTFSVWNRLPIPPDISRRIFQKNFSTKNDLGRGLGTYSMKYFGEEILNGKMGFTSSTEDGTIFRFSLYL